MSKNKSLVGTAFSVFVVTSLVIGLLVGLLNRDWGFAAFNMVGIGIVGNLIILGSIIRKMDTEASRTLSYRAMQISVQSIFTRDIMDIKAKLDGGEF